MLNSLQPRPIGPRLGCVPTAPAQHWPSFKRPLLLGAHLTQKPLPLSCALTGVPKPLTPHVWSSEEQGQRGLLRPWGQRAPLRSEGPHRGRGSQHIPREDRPREAGRKGSTVSWAGRGGSRSRRMDVRQEHRPPSTCPQPSLWAPSRSLLSLSTAPPALLVSAFARCWSPPPPVSSVGLSRLL